MDDAPFPLPCSANGSDVVHPKKHSVSEENAEENHLLTKTLQHEPFESSNDLLSFQKNPPPRSQRSFVAPPHQDTLRRDNTFPGSALNHKLVWELQNSQNPTSPLAPSAQGPFPVPQIQSKPRPNQAETYPDSRPQNYSNRNINLSTPSIDENQTQNPFDSLTNHAKLRPT